MEVVHTCLRLLQTPGLRVLLGRFAVASYCQECGCQAATLVTDGNVAHKLGVQEHGQYACTQQTGQFV